MTAKQVTVCVTEFLQRATVWSADPGRRDDELRDSARRMIYWVMKIASLVLHDQRIGRIEHEQRVAQPQQLQCRVLLESAAELLDQRSDHNSSTTCDTGIGRTSMILHESSCEMSRSPIASPGSPS
jgi:hypothetical protein